MSHLVLKAFVADITQPHLTITYQEDRFVLNTVPASPAKYSRLEFYEGGTAPLLVIPVTRCKFTVNSSPRSTSEWVAIDAEIINLFDTRGNGLLDLSLKLAWYSRTGPPRFTSATFQSSKSGGGGPALCNLADTQHCEFARSNSPSLAELSDLLASGVVLRATSSDGSLLNRFLPGATLESGEIELKLIPIRNNNTPSGAGDRKSPPIPTLQLSQSGRLKESLLLAEFGIQLAQDDRIIYTQRPARRWLGGEKDGQGSQIWNVTVDFPASRVHSWWNSVVSQPYLRALRAVKAGAPISVMPTLGNAAAASQWRCSYRFQTDSDGNLRFQPPLVIPLSGDNVEMQFPNLKPHEGELRVTGALTADGSTDPDDLDQNNRTARIDFRFKATGAGGDAENRIVRLGAFDLDFSRDGKALDSSFQVTFRSDGNVGSIDRVSLITNLALNDAIPAGQDDLPTSEFLPEGFSTGCGADENSTACTAKEELLEQKFRRETPLVLQREPDAVPPPDDSTLLWLSCVETTRLDTSQTVRLSLRSMPLKSRDTTAGNTQASQTKEQQGRVVRGQPAKPSTAANSSPQREVFVLDRDPFLLAMVRYTPIRSLQNEVKDTQEIAWWSNASIEGAAWHVVSKFGRFELVMPPQVVGEAMLKSREIAESDLVPFRLSPPATQTLESSYTPQQFVEVPWNLRRLLGFAGQRDPGAGIVELHYELLYGLACVAKPSDMLRFAEIFSTVGRIPGMLPPLRIGVSKSDAQIAEQFRRDWADLYRRYKSRLAVFEVRRPGPNFGRYDDVSKDPPEILSLSDGVQCTLRQNADLYLPATENPNGDAKCDFAKDDDEFNVCRNGLKGGVTWGFEAPRLYHATVRNPHSDSAKLTGPYFSALGGWGFQKATFDNNRTAIYSHTAMGRVFSYSLERIGRIANYGNVAKHVIQYERAVEPSAQFAGSQNPLAGRPVIRKTKEFVEILETETDFWKQQQNATSGFVRKVIFKTTIITVLSEWGSNVGTTGWKVPLWNRAAALKDPKTYPLPEIIFDVANGTGSSQVSCGNLEPDKLFFYTDTQKDGSSDPHEWALIPFLDFPPLPQPTCRTAFTSNSTNEELQEDPAVPPGFAMFTYAVERTEAGVNLLDGRSERAVAAVLQNITVARSAVISNWDKDLGPANDLIKTAQNKYAELQNLCAKGEVAAERLKAFIAGVCSDQTWTTALDGLDKRLNQESDKLFALIDQRETELFNKFTLELNATFTNLNDEIAAQFKSAWQTAVPTKETLEGIAHAEVVLLAQKLSAVHTRVSAVRNALVSARNAIDAFSHDYQEEYKQTVQHLIDIAKQGAAGLTELRTSVSTSVAEIQHRWSALNSQISASFSSWIPYSNVFVDQVFKPLQGSFSKAAAAVDTELRQPDPNIEVIKSKLADLQAVVFPKLPVGLGAPLDADLTGEFFQYVTDKIRNTIEGLIPDAPPADPNVLLGQIREKLAPDQITTAIAAKLTALQQSVTAQVASAKTYLTDQLKAASLLKEPLNDLKSNLGSLCNVAGTITRQDVTAWLRGLEQGAGRAFEAAVDGLKNSVAANALAQAADTPLRLMRAFGQPPRLPNLDFSLPRLAYNFPQEIPPTLDITPVLTQVKQLGPALEKIGNALNPIGTHLPSIQLFDHFVPPKLPAFNLSSIFPDFGGLKLDNLFPNLKMPAESTDKVKITHGADPATRTAWVTADVDFTSDTNATLFSFGPMALSIPAARFKARVEMTASQRGVERRSKGSISGDWQLVFGGMNLVTLRDTALTFDDGGLHFNVSPEKIELSGALNFISGMLATVTSSGNGLVAGATPTGFEAKLDLPIPDISLGTFGISNLALRSSFALNVKDDFTLKVGFSLASRQTPFTLTIFILGGGGFIEANAEYAPSTGALTCSAHVGITAGASLAIALGPIKGGIYAFVGITIDFDAGGNQARGLAMGAMLLIRGQVSILSIVSAYVAIGLELSYNSGQLVGHGYFSISIKICWCFTLSVSQSITFTLGSDTTRSAVESEPIYVASLLEDTEAVRDSPAFLFADSRSPEFDSAADEYVSMFAEDAA